MAINMMCMNSQCKYYWEDCCTRNMNEKRIEINSSGVCITFEPGVSDWYEEELTEDELWKEVMDGCIKHKQQKSQQNPCL